MSRPILLREDVPANFRYGDGYGRIEVHVCGPSDSPTVSPWGDKHTVTFYADDENGAGGDIEFTVPLAELRRILTHPALSAEWDAHERAEQKAALEQERLIERAQRADGQ